MSYPQCWGHPYSNYILLELLYYDIRYHHLGSGPISYSQGSFLATDLKEHYPFCWTTPSHCSHNSAFLETQTITKNNTEFPYHFQASHYEELEICHTGKIEVRCCEEVFDFLRFCVYLYIYKFFQKLKLHLR